MKELRWVVVLPVLTLLTIEVALRFERVRGLVYGDRGLPALCTPAEVHDEAAGDPALGWLADSIHWEISPRVELTRKVSSAPTDQRVAFVVGDSTCKFGFRESELAAVLGDGTMVRKLCSFKQNFGGGELAAETILQIPRQQQRGVVVWMQTVLTGGFTDTPRRFLNTNEAPYFDLPLRLHVFGTEVLWSIRTLPWSMFVTHTAIGRYNNILTYRLLMSLAGPLPAGAHYYMPDDPELVVMFAADETLDVRTRAMFKRWTKGIPETVGYTLQVADAAAYRSLRAVARAADERNLDVVLLLLPSAMETDAVKHRMIELFPMLGVVWVADVLQRHLILWGGVERECKSLGIRCVEGDSFGIEDFIDNAHFKGAGRDKLLHFLRTAISPWKS